MRRLNMDLVRRVKEEPIMIDSEDDEAHASSSPQNAASNHPAEEDDESLLELRPAQFCKLKFPPPCAVVYTDFNSDPPTVVFTSVQTAYVNIDTHKFVYKLKSGNLVQEEDLLFSKGVPAWAFIGGDFIPATVLAVSQKTSGEAAYTVQDVDSRTLHHFLKTQAVRYRRDATKPALPESLKQDESTTKEESEESSKKEEQEEPSPRINERSTPQVVRPDQMKESMSATPPHQGEAGRHESSNHHTAVKEPMTPATTRHKNDNLEASILRPLRSSREKIVQVKEPAKAQPKLQPRFRAREMVSEMQPPAKRFKNLPFRRLFRLPNWVSRASLQSKWKREQS